MESEEALKKLQPEIDKQKKQEFCLANSADLAPEICNEFLTIYMVENRSLMEISWDDQKNLTFNLCHWLLEN